MKQRKAGLTRREVAVAVAALSPLAAQQAPKVASELEEARKKAMARSAELRKFEISTLLEPSFAFRP
jgi:hypothetical protein